MELFIQPALPKGYILLNGKAISEASRIAYNRANDTVNGWLQSYGHCPTQYLNGRHNIMQAALQEA